MKVVDIISKVDLNRDGVLAAASSRKLDKGGYHLQDPVGVLFMPRPLEHVSSSSSVLGFLDKELEFLGEACSPSGCLSVWTSSEGRALDAWLRKNKFSQVDFIEIFSGSGHLSSEIRRSGLSVAPGIDREYESYGRRWDLADPQDRGLCEALLLRLKPRALHYGLPCDPYSILGQGTPSDGDVQVLSWTLRSMEGHHSEGRLVTLENPVGSQVWHRQEVFKLCGSLLEPKFPWNFVRTDACQYGMESPALDDGSKGMAVEKGQIWLGNYCLSGLSLVCKRPDSLAVIVHEHRHVRGSMKIAEGEGTRWIGFGVWSGKYERACCAAYAACVLRATKPSGSVMLGQEILTSPEEVPKNDTRGPSSIPRTSNQPSERVQVEPPVDVKSNEDLSHEERERLDREVRELSKKMEALWRSRAESKQWDEVKADLGVYRLSGQSVKEDPRRSSDYIGTKLWKVSVLERMLWRRDRECPSRTSLRVERFFTASQVGFGLKGVRVPRFAMFCMIVCRLVRRSANNLTTSRVRPQLGWMRNWKKKSSGASWSAALQRGGARPFQLKRLLLTRRAVRGG